MFCQNYALGFEPRITSMQQNTYVLPLVLTWFCSWLSLQISPRDEHIPHRERKIIDPKVLSGKGYVIVPRRVLVHILVSKKRMMRSENMFKNMWSVVCIWRGQYVFFCTRIATFISLSHWIRVYLPTWMVVSCMVNVGKYASLHGCLGYGHMPGGCIRIFVKWFVKTNPGSQRPSKN